MRKLILTVLIASGLGLAAGGASALPAAGVLDGVSGATPLVEQVQNPRYRHYQRMYRDRNRYRCRSVQVCRMTPWGTRRCHIEQRCPR